MSNHPSYDSITTSTSSTNPKMTMTTTLLEQEQEQQNDSVFCTHINDDDNSTTTTTTTTTTTCAAPGVTYDVTTSIDESQEDDDPNYHHNNNDNDETFFHIFIKSNGPPQIILIVLSLAISFGCVIGVVPAVMTDRYARLYHNYTNPINCGDYNSNDKPIECYEGSSDAQNAAAIENIISSLCTFLTSSYFGSISDMYGRKRILILSMILCTARPIILVLLQTYSEFHPIYYYIAGGIGGLFNWMALSLSCISDVMPNKWRAPCFGLLLASFSLGIAISPIIAVQLGHYEVSILSLFIICIGVFISIFALPETVSYESAQCAKRIHNEQKNIVLSYFHPNNSINNSDYQQVNSNNGQDDDDNNIVVTSSSTWKETILWNICYRPIWELSILNRNRLFRLLSLLAFFSGIAASGDQTLLVYYVEEQLNFHDKDIATMFLIFGILGIFVQSFILKLMNSMFGERAIVIIAFTFGVIHNVLYGIAHNKITIYIAIALGSLNMMAFPTISAIKANNVDRSEQGRIQGALYSISALASAMGPTMMRWVYHYTKDGAWMGPGSMFLVAASLYTIAVYCSYLLPVEANSEKRQLGASSTSTSTVDDVDALNLMESDMNDSETATTQCRQNLRPSIHLPLL